MDEKKEPDGERPLPFACITPDGMLVGALPDDIDYETFTASATAGRYSAPGDLASIAICPRALNGTQAGLLLGVQFPGPDGKTVDHVEVARVSYAAFINCMVAIVRGMQELDLLKSEPQGQMLADMLAAAEAERQTLQ